MKTKSCCPSFAQRVGSVWFRHVKVYSKDLVSNAFPSFVEPLVFLVGVGLGLGKYIVSMDHVPYIQFLASGLLVTSAMFTSTFECTYGTFIRLEYDKVYDGMMAAPLKAQDIILGEMLWAGTKGLFFSFCVLLVMLAFGVISLPWSLFTPVVGFLTGLLFAALSLFFTSCIKNINAFNFYFTGFLSPMFYFAGVVFPISNLPAVLRPISEVLPLTHVVRLSRFFCLSTPVPTLPWDLLYVVGVIFLVGALAVHRLRSRLVG